MREFLRRFLAVVRKEVLQLRGDRLSAGMVFGVPIVQLLLFGYAINQDVRGLRAGVADVAQTHASRALVESARASQVIDLVYTARGPGELEDALRRGEITVGIYIPADFERRRARGDSPLAQLLADGSDPVVMGAARGLSSLGVEPEPLVVGAAVASAGPTFETRAYYNPEGRSAVQIVPALIGVILTMTMTLFTAIAIVRERERGNLELLITTPIRRGELLMAKITPYVIIGLVQVSLVLAIGAWLFDVHSVGTLADVYGASVLFVVATLGLGLLISTVAPSPSSASENEGTSSC